MDVMKLSFVYKGSVQSDLEYTKAFIKRILNKVKYIVEDQDVLFDIRLILNELIINSVIHGNQCNSSRQVNLFLEIKGNTIRIEVADEGHGINIDNFDCDPRDLKCCGRGLVIVDGLSDEVHIENNRIIAIKHI